MPDPVRVDTDEAFEDAFAQIQARIDRLNLAVDTGTPDPDRADVTTGAGSAELSYP